MKAIGRYAASFVFGIVVLILQACGGGGTQQSPTTPTPPPTPGSTSTVLNVFLKDAPVDNVAALSLQVVSASVKNANTSATTLSPSAQTVEIRHLELAPTMVFSQSVTNLSQMDTMSVTFSTPKLMIVNADGTTQALTASTTPSVRLANNSATLAIPGANLQNKTPLVLDFDLSRSLSVDANGNYLINPVITATAAVSQDVDVPGLQGKVVSADTHQLTVTLGNGLQQTFSLDSGSVIESSTAAGTPTLSAGDAVIVDAIAKTNGDMTAKFVRTGAPNGTAVTVGVVSSLIADSNGNPLIKLVAQQ